MGFWIWLSVFWACEAWLYSRGHETFLFTHKTKAEKAIRDKQTDNRSEHK